MHRRALSLALVPAAASAVLLSGCSGSSHGTNASGVSSDGSSASSSSTASPSHSPRPLDYKIVQQGMTKKQAADARPGLLKMTGVEYVLYDDGANVLRVYYRKTISAADRARIVAALKNASRQY